MKRFTTKIALSTLGILTLLMLGGTVFAANRTATSQRAAFCGQECSVPGTACPNDGAVRCLCVRGGPGSEPRCFPN